ncbi:CmpA/NrtA family ABC transporter substrate-binding protein [Trinickia caryophylli]|uniref:Nitrate/nitrite transport system substrate-binding protein n=1 Tax=Trinickia caryophylli TaxID=28094 RepID=A0A1X7HA19_TRICW|nr:CmpA/NrtA family ABC transporter substrate-binding protein [Trinickia caryophylli]PMS08985.1 nitrate ABC transporter substrate-binding protein [Trinickia caryophylli]TRX15023.1 ABC transporter substrate-binding protein [Trinickia caryophylli]WQE14880.1 CmpA/NrtA family ABC transporter substrate-binding protein [Trinickia caryophylli]SMF82194.1 nitrate/nitrite transport system substrate-binding protein [Trinickia caryophylli]GLU35774.1 nitrate transporter component [Trinickia caryophylli]
MDTDTLAHAEPSPVLEKTHLRLGFVALSDAAPLMAAKVLEFGHRHGLTLELCRQPSWAAVRDKLLSGELDAAHALYGLVYGVQLGIGGPQADMAVLMVLNRNGQAITLSTPLARALDMTGGDLKAALAKLGRTPVFAQTFPTGTHAMWLYYWLAAQGVHPLKDIESVVIPPPRMVDALARQTLDGFCAGEPWHALAEASGAGETVAATSEIWPGHPEKVLACRRDFVSRYPATARALIRTMLEACRWVDTPSHREEIAPWLAEADALDVPRELIVPRLVGREGGRRFGKPPLPVAFFEGGAVNYPRISDGRWFIAQYRRWGLLKGEPTTAEQDAAVAAAINQTALYREAAALADVPIPEETRTDVLCDGMTWR